MDKAVCLLIVIQCAFQISGGLKCGQVKKPSRAVFLEWSEFPKGRNPDFYVVTYHLTDDLAQKNVKSVSTTQLKAQNVTILLEEGKKYDVMVQSLKNGKILHAQSFKTCGISDIVKTHVTSTSALFSWNILANDFSVEISCNNISRMFKHNEVFYEWTDLRPATLYTFSFKFKQLHLDFVNVSQMLDVHIETGLCSDGWTAFKHGCYKVSKESKPWSVAQQSCELFSSGARLVDIKNKEEHAFLTSYLRSFSHVIMLWTGLNDIKEEGHLSWTDDSPYFGQSEFSSLPMIPENETDCYAFQRNSSGPNYFFMPFFCYIPLPYICKYELSSVPENFTFKVQDFGTDEAALFWSSLIGWFTSDFQLSIKYYFELSEQHSETFTLNSTQTKILKLCPGRLYNFLLSARSPEGAHISLHPVRMLETRPLHLLNVKATRVTSSEIVLQWDYPMSPCNASFHNYLISILESGTTRWEAIPFGKSNTSAVIGNLKPYHQYQLQIQSVAEKGTLSCYEDPMLIVTGVSPPMNVFIYPEDIGEDHVIIYWKLPQEGQESYIQARPSAVEDKNMVFLVNNTESFKIELLIPGMTYEIGVATVTNGNKSDLNSIQCTLKPKPVQIVIPYEVQSHSVVLFVQMPAVGVFDGLHVMSKRGPNATTTLSTDGKVTIENLIPGTEYDFFVSTTSGSMLSSVYHLPAIRTCLAVPLNVHEGRVTDISIQIIWDRADGNFQQYEVTCINYAGIFMVQKVTKELAEFSSLIPGSLYNFTVKTEKEGYKDSLPVSIQIETVPSSVKYMNFSKDSESITLTWPPALGIFDGYIITLACKNYSKEEKLSSDIRKHRFDGLSSGTDYFIKIVTKNRLKRSFPATLKISTCPDPPLDLQAFGIEENTVYLSWELPNGSFDHFELSHGLATSVGFLHTTAVPVGRAVVENLMPGVEYVFQVKTIKGKDFSVAVERKVTTKPMKICGLTLTLVNTSSATLTWNPKKTNFTHYKASVSNSTFTKEYTILGTRTHYTITDLTAGGIYNFTLQRVKGSVESPVAFTEITAEPEKPQKLRVFNVSAHSFSLHWRLPHGYVERFHVVLTPPHGFVSIRDVGGGEYQADISSTTPGTVYNVTVSSVTSSVYSSPVSKTVTTNVTNPGPPVFLAGERVGSAGILLSWNTPPHPNGRIISYIVKYKEVCPWMQNTYTQVTTKPDSLEVLLTNLNPGTTYEIQVAAENSAGIGVFSDPFLFQTAESAPGKVVNLTVEAFNYSAVNLIWFLPRQPNGKITSFKISVKHARSGIVVKDVSVKVEDLLSGRLPECNDNSESFLWSTTTPSTTPSKTTMLTPSTVAPSKMISVWNEPISFVVTNLRPYTTYLFEVSAVTTEAGYIDSAIVRTPESVPEDPPQNFVKVNITGKSFSVSWEPPTIVTGKFSYRVELYGPLGHILDNSTKDLKFTFTNLIPFTTYDAFVAAETSAGVGPKSNLTVFTPAGVPGPVFDLHMAEVSATFVRIGWKKPQQPNGIITQYRVKVSLEDTGEILEDTILTEKIKDFIEALDPDVLNENTEPSFMWDEVETVTGSYEGSAEMFPTVHNFSPVIFTSMSEDNLPILNRAAELHPGSAEQLSYLVNGLQPFTKYAIEVSAFTIIGEGPPALLIARTSEQVPSSVENINYKNISSSSVLLYWDIPINPNGKITHYTVYAMELDTHRAFHMTTSNNSILITGLRKYTNYKMRVAASTTIGESALSEDNDIFVRTPEDEPGSPPQHVEILEVTATEISLRWSPPEKPNGIITHYEVMCDDASALILRNTTATNLLLNGLKPYTLYNISVRAFTRLGHGNQSSPLLSVRTADTVPEFPPQNVTYKNISSSEIELSFLPPSVPNGIIETYTVYLRETDGTDERTINTTHLSLTITGLKIYTRYIVEVSSSTVKGEGPRSAPLHMLTDEDAPSSPPRLLTVKQLSGVIVKLSWQPPLEPNGIILYYTVYVWNIISRRSINVTETSLDITDLENKMEYSVYVTASTRFGDGNIKSDMISFITSEGAPSDPPKNVWYKNLTSSSVRIFWDPPQKPNGVIQFYSIYYKNDSDTYMQNFTSYAIDSGVDNATLSTVLSNLAKWSHYTLWLSASTAFGNGNQTSEIIHLYTDQDVPDGPVEQLAYQNISSTAVNISWMPPAQPNGMVFYKVSLTMQDAQTDHEILSLILNDTNVVLRKLEKYTSYLLKITPATENGVSEMHTASLHIRTEEDVPESAPIMTSYKNLSSTSVMLSWDPPARANGIIISYVLKLHGLDRNDSFTTSNNSVVLEDLSPFVLYSFYVSARTGKGLGPSTVLMFFTDESVPLAPPENLTIANYTSNSVWLKWNPSPQPNGVIQRYVFNILDNCSQTTFYQNISGSHNEANILGLEPFNTYFISVSAFTKVGNGNQFSNLVQLTTMESAPDIVQNIQCTATSWQSVLVQWDPPLKTNGIITHYIITFGKNSTILSSDNETVHTFRDLLSNTSYQFKIQAVTAAGDGKEQLCNASTFPETAPSAPRDISFSSIQSTSVTLRWRMPVTIFGYFQNYKITAQLRSIHCNNWEAAECIEYEQEQYSYTVGTLSEETVYDLKKFRWYRFRVSASTNAGFGTSSPWISTQTLPGFPDAPPENVTVVVTSPYSINISWSEPVIITGPTFYLIDITSVDTDDYKASFIKTNDEDKNLDVSGLRAFTRYSVVVTAFTGDIHAAHIEGKSSPAVIVSTFEAVPRDPLNNITFQKIPDEVTKFQVTFISPSEHSGNIQVYQAMVYKEDDPTFFQIYNLSVIDRTNKSVTALIEGLKGGHTYNISVYAINGAGAGPKIQLKITTDIKEPPRPSKKPVPVYDTSGMLVTATTITIRMPVCYYNDDHGPIKKIQILVAEAGAQHDGNVTKWYDAYFRKPRPYFVNEGFPNPPCAEGNEGLSSKDDVYVIGADSTCMIPGSEEKICNGPLKPRRQYLFKFRATNIKGQFTDSDYSDPIKTLGDGLSERAVEIILAVTLCILSVILLVAAIYAFARIRQKQKEGGTYSPRDAEIIDTKFKLDQLITVADLEMKDERFTRYSSFFFRRKEIFVIQLLSYRKSIKPIGKKCFLQHVEELCTNNNLKFQEEFLELPKFLPDLASADADLPWNRSKNRFPNIKPYNNNRVKLMPDASIPGSDYINASYVSGYLCPNEFIATQGPLPGTVGDFWRMVWETRAKTLVMLTQCFEKGRIRCHQYWPEDNIPVTVFGDIVITKLVEDVQIDWTIRDLKIERHGDCMMVRQCNFTAWPEHGVPETTASLVHFVKLIRASRAHDSTPIVVHCSAGVGRTGVYIALDHLTQHINDHDFVDIYGLVAELRSERMCMVQNLAQYIFLHQCVLDLLTIKRSSQPVCFVNYSVLQKMDSFDAMEGDVELEWEETTM
ncbi:phosphatidylinositol phosphatase PTPRQ isoform X2 [Podarcis raffonei]|uniref:phosphatidylinositol phosphatase PTPRQ isoform X2 n=1 Tax=Podarcis raffonei TaxID=65483 RepID=UPI00232969B4|nr:phosphatidylinositol phosphatase PTPRQ isoform X2 [Podarcis raffonei]